MKLTIFLFSSCGDGAESPSEGCMVTITGTGFAMSSLMAIIAAILLLICEFFNITVECQFRGLETLAFKCSFVYFLQKFLLLTTWTPLISLFLNKAVKGVQATNPPVVDAP